MFYIAYYGTSGNGYVDYNGDTCNSIDNAMTFDTKEEAEEYREKLQEEWASELRVEEYVEDMTYSVYGNDKCWVSGLTLDEAHQWVADKDNPAMYEIAADDEIVND